MCNILVSIASFTSVNNCYSATESKPDSLTPVSSQVHPSVNLLCQRTLCRPKVVSIPMIPPDFHHYVSSSLFSLPTTSRTIAPVFDPSKLKKRFFSALLPLSDHASSSSSTPTRRSPFHQLLTLRLCCLSFPLMYFGAISTRHTFSNPYMLSYEVESFHPLTIVLSEL